MDGVLSFHPWSMTIVVELLHKKCHRNSYHNDIRYHMTLNTIFSVVKYPLAPCFVIASFQGGFTTLVRYSYMLVSLSIYMKKVGFHVWLGLPFLQMSFIYSCYFYFTVLQPMLYLNLYLIMGAQFHYVTPCNDFLLNACYQILCSTTKKSLDCSDRERKN